MIRSSLARMASSTMNVFGWSSDRELIRNMGDLGNIARRCIEKHQWERFRTFLRRIEYTSTDPYGLGLAAVDTNGRTLLHVLCSNTPPLDVVETIARLFPSMLSATDGLSRTPLHDAVLHRAALTVVEFLLASKPECTMIGDFNGKTPLILACEEIGLNLAEDAAAAASGLFDAYEVEALTKYLCELVRMLALYSPASVLAEDREGMTALERALDSEAPRTTIRVLQHVTLRMVRKADMASRDAKRARARARAQERENSSSMGLLMANVSTRNSLVAAGA